MDDRVAANTVVVSGREIFDPANHGVRFQAIASRTFRGICQINDRRSVSGSWMLKMCDPYPQRQRDLGG